MIIGPWKVNRGPWSVFMGPLNIIMGPWNMIIGPRNVVVVRTQNFIRPAARGSGTNAKFSNSSCVW